MCQFIFQKRIDELGISADFHVESAATTREELGNPVYPPARKVLAEHGIRCDGKTARLMTWRDYPEFDYLIGMDEENRRDMKRITGGDPEGKVSCLLDYSEHPREVADPWYTRNFEVTWDDLVEGCEAFLAFLGYV